MYSSVVSAMDQKDGKEVAIKVVRSNETMFTAGRKEIEVATPPPALHQQWILFEMLVHVSSSAFFGFRKRPVACDALTAVYYTDRVLVPSFSRGPTRANPAPETLIAGVEATRAGGPRGQEAHLQAALEL